MKPDLLQLQVQYANAVYQAEKWGREAAIAKQLLDEIAQQEAEAKFVPAQPTGRNRKGVHRNSGGLA